MSYQRVIPRDLFNEASLLKCYIGLYDYLLTRPLNSRGAWPLYAERIDDPNWEIIAVFDEEGGLTPEMAGLISWTQTS